MNLYELCGPDAALIHEAWRQRLARWSKALGVDLKRRSPAALDPIYAEAAAPEGAMFVAAEKPGALPRRDVKAITQPVTRPIRGLA